MSAPWTWPPPSVYAYPIGPASGDLAANFPAPTVVAVHSGATQLALGTIPDGQLVGRSGANLVGVVNTAPPVLDVAASAPASWWRADNTTQSGGLVDAIIDNGSLAKNFAATLADRCAVGTDADGKTYLNLTNAFYQAGVATDWKFLADGSSDWTIGFVYAKPTWPGNSNTPLALLTNLAGRSNVNAGGGGIGCYCGVNASGSVGGGTGSFWGWEMNQMNLNGTMCNMTTGKSLQSTPAPTTKQVILWRSNRFVRQVQYGGTGAENVGQGVNYAWSDLWEGGEPIQYQQDAATYNFSTATPQGTLTLGQSTDRAFPFTGRVYEVVIWKRRLNNNDARGYALSAASRYIFSLL